MFYFIKLELNSSVIQIFIGINDIPFDDQYKTILGSKILKFTCFAITKDYIYIEILDQKFNNKESETKNIYFQNLLTNIFKSIKWSVEMKWSDKWNLPTSRMVNSITIFIDGIAIEGEYESIKFSTLEIKDFVFNIEKLNTVSDFVKKNNLIGEKHLTKICSVVNNTYPLLIEFDQSFSYLPEQLIFFVLLEECFAIFQPQLQNKCLIVSSVETPNINTFKNSLNCRLLDIEFMFKRDINRTIEQYTKNLEQSGIMKSIIRMQNLANNPWFHSIIKENFSYLAKYENEIELAIRNFYLDSKSKNIQKENVYYELTSEQCNFIIKFLIYLSKFDSLSEIVSEYPNLKGIITYSIFKEDITKNLLEKNYDWFILLEQMERLEKYVQFIPQKLNQDPFGLKKAADTIIRLSLKYKQNFRNFGLLGYGFLEERFFLYIKKLNPIMSFIHKDKLFQLINEEMWSFFDLDLKILQRIKGLNSIINFHRKEDLNFSTQEISLLSRIKIKNNWRYLSIVLMDLNRYIDKTFVKDRIEAQYIVAEVIKEFSSYFDINSILQSMPISKKINYLAKIWQKNGPDFAKKLLQLVFYEKNKDTKILEIEWNIKDYNFLDLQGQERGQAEFLARRNFLLHYLGNIT